jgi:hypothetical protein
MLSNSMTALQILRKNDLLLELTVEDGEIWTWNVDIKVRKVMDLSPIWIEYKHGYQEKPDGEVAYQFKLSSITDPVWREFFKLTLKENLKASIEGNHLELISTPGAVASDLAATKEAVKVANERYARDREEVLKEAMGQDERRALDTAEEEERRRQVQASYDALKL